MKRIGKLRNNQSIPDWIEAIAVLGATIAIWYDTITKRKGKGWGRALVSRWRNCAEVATGVCSSSGRFPEPLGALALVHRARIICCCSSDTLFSSSGQ